MKFSQKTFALLIIVGALLIAGFLFFNKSDHRISFGFPSGPESNETVIINALDDRTQDIAKGIAKTIIEQNPEGPTEIDGELGVEVLDPDEIIDQFLEETAGPAREEALNPDLFFDDLDVISNASTEDLEFYIITRGQIIDEARKEAESQGANLSTPSIANFVTFLDVTSWAIDQLYELPVPEEALFIHKEQLRLLSIQENIFKNLINYEGDPVAASVSVSLLLETNEELMALSKTINQFVIDNDLDV